MLGSWLIVQERRRQFTVEGRTPEHDATHVDHELLRAALCYVTNVSGVIIDGDIDPPPNGMWPWAPEDWKPGDPIADLVKAGALIAAEIDRLAALDPAGAYARHVGRAS